MAATIPQLRAMVQDTTEPYQLPDGDYDVFIGLEENTYRAAALACDALAAKYALKVNIKAGPVSLANTQKWEHYIGLAKDYNQRAREGGGWGPGGGGVVGTGVVVTGTSLGEIDAVNDDPDRYDSVFYRGLDSNPVGVVDDDGSEQESS